MIIRGDDPFVDMQFILYKLKADKASTKIACLSPYSQMKVGICNDSM